MDDNSSRSVNTTVHGSNAVGKCDGPASHQCKYSTDAKKHEGREVKEIVWPRIYAGTIV